MPKTSNTTANKSFVSSSIATVWDMVQRWGAQEGVEDEIVEGLCEFVELDIRGTKPKAKPAPTKGKGKGKGKVERAEPAASAEESSEDESGDASKPVVWILKGCAKTPKPTDGVVYPKSLASKVVSAVGERGDERKLGRKYDGVSFLSEDLDDVKESLESRFTVRVKNFANVKPEDFPWAEAKGKAKTTPKGKGKPGPKGKGKPGPKGKAKAEEVSEEPEEETEEDEPPKAKGKGKAPKGKGAKAKNPKVSDEPLFEENQWGNVMSDFNLVFADLALKGKKGATQVCIGVQDTDAEDLEDDAEPWETLHQLDEDNLKLVKKFEKKHGVKVTCIADVYEKLKDEKVKQRLADSGLVEEEEEETDE